MKPPRDKVRRRRRRAPLLTGSGAPSGDLWPIRMRCIELLRLDKGDTVLDVGCGTGLSFELLLEQIGRSGLLIAFEPDPRQHAQAAERAQGLRAQGWQIELQCANAEEVQLPARPDAVLFHYVHDITRAPKALDNLFAQVPPGARLAIAGMKFLPWWLAPLNLVAWLKNRRRIARAHELHKPWSLVEPHLQGFTWKPTQGGLGYIGCGRVRGAGL